MEIHWLKDFLENTKLKITYELSPETIKDMRMLNVKANLLFGWKQDYYTCPILDECFFIKIKKEEG